MGKQINSECGDLKIFMEVKQESYKLIISPPLAPPASSENCDKNISNTLMVLVIKDTSKTESEGECQERIEEFHSAHKKAGCEPVGFHSQPSPPA